MPESASFTRSSSGGADAHEEAADAELEEAAWLDGAEAAGAAAGAERAERADDDELELGAGGCAGTLEAAFDGAGPRTFA